MEAEEWIAKFAEATGSPPPDEAEFSKLLRLASVAAHSSERKAAPIACWIAGREGLDPDEAIRLADRIGEDEQPG